ncbi:unnamed protein product [Plutella xylostella]|uniref:(diamondback moth) hypothetical protein n=1 Tax=Plutella xylostella TaxID=51655 RepID=A0A8S4GD37_PLUXY|nr:unnamed protein product [Plutella xylostella]
MLCASCDNEVNDSAKCSQCHKNICFRCANVTEAGFRKLGVDRRATWKCPSCRISPPAAPTSTRQITGNMEEVLQKLAEVTAKLDDLPKLMLEVGALKSNMDEVKQSCSKIDEFAAKLDGIDKRIKSLELLKDEVSTIKASFESLKEDFAQKDQWSRLNNVEIKGIPIKKNENLFTVAKLLSNHVGYPIENSQINYISRIPIHNSKEKSILISFLNRYVKEEFISTARAKKITASDMDLGPADQRIYVNDHLSPMYKNLLTRAKSLAKEKNYKYVWVKFAKIHMRKSDTTHVITINSANDLNKII